METATISLQKRQNIKQLHSNSNKPIPQGFMTFEEFSKKLDDKINAHYKGIKH
jgi:hypothetical protein